MPGIKQHTLNTLTTKQRQGQKRQRKAFTLLQIMIVIAVLAIFAAVLLPILSQSRASARRAQCDVRLKAIVLALDAFSQEQSEYPRSLEELHAKGFITDPASLRCPVDPRPQAEAGYGDYYILRARRDASDSPLLVCPFHEEDSHGAQAYKGRYTTQLSAQPARIVSASSTLVHRPGKQPIAAAAGMSLRGGDRLVVAGGSSSSDSGLIGGLLGSTGLVGDGGSGAGQTVIQFEDGSKATLHGGSDLTVLQSFVTSNTGVSPLYTLVKQSLGRVDYEVNHGSPFDVATPTATAGARGTKFTVVVESDGETGLLVTEGKVLFSTLESTLVAPLNQTLSSTINGLINLL